MKRIPVFVLVCMMLLVVCAPSFAAEKKIKLGASFPTQEVERWVRNKNNLIEEAERRGIEILVQMANDDAARQIAQVENLIAQGVDVMLIAPHDAKSAATAAEACKEAGIPVFSYCRLILDADLDAHVAFDNFKVGELQGQYLAEHVPKGNIVVLAGAKEDFNSFLFRDGALKYIQPLVDKGDVKIVMQQHATDWEPEEAMKIVENALTAVNNDIAGVLAPNDGLAGGAIQALAAQGLAGKVPVTGGDAGLDAAKRIIQGTQSMTVYRDLMVMDKASIELAIRLAKGEDFSDMTTGTIDNEFEEVPAILPQPEIVTRENIDEVLIDSGYHSREDCYGN